MLELMLTVLCFFVGLSFVFLAVVQIMIDADRESEQDLYSHLGLCVNKQLAELPRDN